MTENIFNRLKVQIKKTYYVYDRYNTLATFGLIYHEKPLSVEELAKCVRISDQFIQIDDNHYFVNFSYTSHEDAFKASQNIIFFLDKFFNNTTTCIGIDAFNTSYSAKIVLNRLEQILEHTRKNSYSRIEDHAILSGMF